MAQVTVRSLTAERMIEIEESSVVSGNVQGDILVLVTKGGAQITAGNVRGPQGDQGDQGETGPAGGVQIGGNIGGTMLNPTITGELNDTVDVTDTKINIMYDFGAGPISVSMPLADLLTTVLSYGPAIEQSVRRGGDTVELWTGTMADYLQLPVEDRNAQGFVAVIRP